MERDKKLRWVDFINGFEENRKVTLEKRDFVAEIEAAMKTKVKKEDDYGEEIIESYRSKADKLKDLDALLEKGTSRLDSSQIMALFSSYRSLGEYDRMIDIYNHAENKDFTEAPFVREQLAHAYRKRRFVASGKDSRDDLLRSEAISRRLIEDGYGNGITYENIGLCQRYRAGMETEDSSRRQMLLQKSVATLEEGFAQTFEASLGLQAAYGNVMIGNDDRGRETAKLAFMAALRDGAEDSGNFNLVSTALQAACLAGEPKEVVDHFCRRIEATIKHDWELDIVKKRMEQLCARIPSEQSRDVLKRIEGFEQNRKDGTDETGRIIFKDKVKEDRYITDDPVSQAVHDNSYNYRGCGLAYSGMDRIAGNTRFGGQLMDHVISRKDIRLMSEMVKMTPAELGIPMSDEEKKAFDRPLSQIKDPEKTLDLIDRFVRQSLTTENFAGTGLHMEDNALAKNKNGESVYDATVKSMMRASGKAYQEKDSHIDTRTNIVAMLALGMGDCRHHAQLKQLMFDMCQRSQMNEQIGKLYADVRQDKVVDTDGEAARKFYDVLDTELRTADVQVRMPVLMKQKNAEGWAREQEGKWQKDENGIEYWHAKILRDEDGKKIWNETVFGQAKPGEEAPVVKKDRTYEPELTEDGKFRVDPKGLMHNVEDHTLCYLMRRERKTGRLTSLKTCDAFYQSKDYDWKLKEIDLKAVRVSRSGNPLIPVGKLSGARTDTGEPVRIFHVPTRYNTGERSEQVKDSIGRDVCFCGIRMAGFDTVDDLMKMVRNRKKMAAVMLTTLRTDKETKDIDTLLPERKAKAADNKDKKAQCEANRDAYAQKTQKAGQKSLQKQITEKHEQMQINRIDMKKGPYDR